MGVVSPPSGPRSKRIRTIEKRFGEPVDVVLRRLYYEEGLTLDEIAAKLRIPRGTLGGWMIRFGINQRAVAEQAGKELAS
jgi:hypothetical protein